MNNIIEFMPAMKKHETPSNDIHVLIIEDSDADAAILKSYLKSNENNNYILEIAQTIEIARNKLEHDGFDIILLDYSLPDGTASEFLNECKDKLTCPVVVMTGRKDKAAEEAVLLAGASDFIPKDNITSELLERVIKFSIERQKNLNLIKEQIIRDPLTGLYNRLGMEKLLSAIMQKAKMNDEQFSILLIDVDKFKSINDTFGHAAGDEILKIIASCLTASTRCSREKDFSIRIGGDEFALLATDLDDIQNINLIIERLSQKLSRSFDIDGYSISVSLSIGVAIYPEDGTTKDELINNADFSLYRAKKKVGTTFEFFDKNKRQDVDRRNFIEKSIPIAIKEDQFDLFYQPKVSSKNQSLIGAEALIRWQHPEKGIIWPREFIHITEETGHILEIGSIILYKACQQAAKWRSLYDKPFSMAVNVSIRQLLHRSFVETVCDALYETGLDPKLLELEITESLVIQNLNKSIKVIQKLRKLGISISLDDFGSGYSSLGRLRSLPINKLKIDRSLIKRVGKNRFDTAITRTVLSLAKNLKLTAVAEGVETEEQYRFLKKAGCPELQGYYFSKPIPAHEFQNAFLLSKIIEDSPEIIKLDRTGNS